LIRALIPNSNKPQTTRVVAGPFTAPFFRRKGYEEYALKFPHCKFKVTSFWRNHPGLIGESGKGVSPAGATATQ
jgi:hypothetical protein